MMSGVHVSTTVNGDAVEYVCQGRETMLDVLRNRLGLIGAKEGCGTGDCGACSVTVDGQLVCSCLMLGAEAEGRDIQTVEGLAHKTKPIFCVQYHPEASPGPHDSTGLFARFADRVRSA